MRTELRSYLSGEWPAANAGRVRLMYRGSHDGRKKPMLEKTQKEVVEMMKAALFELFELQFLR